MADLETIKIPELEPTSSAGVDDQLIIRQGVSDKRISVSALKSSIIAGATGTVPGVVTLNNTVTSTSVSQAGTANSVRLAYNRGTEALTAANNFGAQLPGKANLNHTHAASDVVSGIFSRDRLPMGGFFSPGILQIDSTGGAVSSSAGYVPSVERANDLQRQINDLRQQLENVEVGGAFMPLPLDNAGQTYADDFPIGSYVIASAGANVGVRNQQVYVSPVPINATAFGSSYIGQFSIGGYPESHNLKGKWLHRGAVGPMVNPISKGMKAWSASYENEYNIEVNVAILCQRVA